MKLKCTINKGSELVKELPFEIKDNAGAYEDRLDIISNQYSIIASYKVVGEPNDFINELDKLLPQFDSSYSVVIATEGGVVLADCAAPTYPSIRTTLENGSVVRTAQFQYNKDINDTQVL